jgi:mRNA interferase MazF
VPFPFDEIPVRKRRPVPVFSGRTFNEANGHSVVAMITAAKETSWPSDIWIDDLQSAGLLVPCVARLCFQTMPNDMIARSIGKLAALDRLRCEKQLADMLS